MSESNYQKLAERYLKNITFRGRDSDLDDSEYYMDLLLVEYAKKLDSLDDVIKDMSNIIHNLNEQVAILTTKLNLSNYHSNSEK